MPEKLIVGTCENMSRGLAQHVAGFSEIKLAENVKQFAATTQNTLQERPESPYGLF